MQINDAHKSRKGSIALAVGCFLLQVMIAPNVGLEYGRFNFALVFAGLYALRTGGRMGVACAFVAGLLYDLVTTGPVGLMSALLTVFAYAVGAEERNRFADGFVGSLSTFGVGALLVLLAYNFTIVMLGDSGSVVDVLFLRTLPSFAMTFVAFLPFAYVQVKKASKTSWLGSAGKASSLRGNHYDVRDL